MSAELQAVANLLEGTLDPQRNRGAELALRQQESRNGFSVLLLQIVATDSYPSTTRLAGALCFKNFIRRNWVDADGNHKLPNEEVVAIKQELIGLMISSPPRIQSQLGDAISVIADSDFWERWDTLVDDLISRLTYDNSTVNNGVLQVAHSIFKRWRPLFRSDPLFTEINHVLNKFGKPFLALFSNVDELIGLNKDNQERLPGLFATLNLLVKLFFDLSCQDLPPIFEEHLPLIASWLHKYLTYDNPILHTDDEAESGLLEYVKAGICEALVLYTQKYDDAFGPHLNQFITSSWNLLTTIGPETKYDILVSKALQFLSSVASSREHAQSFNNEQTLSQVVEKVILPNLSLRDSDIELLEDDPLEFIRRDLEGSDGGTRRHAATEFLRQLMQQFERLVTEVVSRYIDHYIAEYSKDPKNNWRSKDTAVYLFSSIAAKGVVTVAQGVKSTNTLVDVVDFFQRNIARDLVAEPKVEPILEVDAIKYLYTFRSQLTKQQWHDALPLLVKHLSSSDYVVYTYAAIAIERTLHLTNHSGEPVLARSDILPLGAALLQQLFQLIEKESAPERVQENEFLMKCVMRVLIVIKDGVVPMADVCLKHLISITEIISNNPSNPRFCYYHFEALGSLIRYGAPSQSEKFENALYPPLATILAKDVQDFMPYVFQLFAVLLEANPSGGVSEYYKGLLPPILTPTLWESRGNIPALVRLLSAFLPRVANDVVSEKRIEPILGIFQKLISSKANEGHAFDLLEAIVTYISATALHPYFVPMFNILLMRLQPKSKTDHLVMRFVRYYHFMCTRQDQGLGTDYVESVIEQVQTGVFPELYTSIILPETQKTIKPLDRKTAVISLTRTLTDSAAFADKYKKGWTYTCGALLKLLETGPLPNAAAVEDQEQDVDDLSFGVGFTQLSSCRQTHRDPWPEIPDLKRWVGRTMSEADGRYGGRISSYIQERLSPEAKSVLVSYMRS